VRNGPVSGRAVFLSRFAGDKPSFASLCPNTNLPGGPCRGLCSEASGGGVVYGKLRLLGLSDSIRRFDYSRDDVSTAHSGKSFATISPAEIKLKVVS
jgi:hypothetical protein